MIASVAACERNVIKVPVLPDGAPAGMAGLDVAITNLIPEFIYRDAAIAIWMRLPRKII
jgi:hypothetical protein